MNTTVNCQNINQLTLIGYFIITQVIFINLFINIFKMNEYDPSNCLVLAEIVRRRKLAAAVAANLFVVNTTQLFKKKKVRKHRWWVHPINQNRQRQGDWDNLIQEMKLCDEALFFNYTRLNIQQFDKLLGLILHNINKTNMYREPIPPGARLAVTLRYLSTGDSLPSLAYSFRIGKSTACKIIHETCDAIWELSSKYCLFPSTPEQWKLIAKGYEEKWQLPHCVGAMDGKHVVIQAPKHSGSQFFNYKKSHSIVLFAVCDAHYNFIYVDIGAYGSQSDGGILRECDLGKKLFNIRGHLNLPEEDNLTNSDIVAPYFFVGDEAFPLHENLMRPYGGTGLSGEKRIFNYRLSRARRCIENAFGILVSRFRIFHRVINASPKTVDSIIKATVVLHNFIKFEECKYMRRKYCPANYVDTYDLEGNVIPGDWRNNIPEHSALGNIRNLPRRLGSRNSTKSAEQHRTNLLGYVNSEVGEVSWQNNIN